jgi:hypothetical protein
MNMPASRQPYNTIRGKAPEDARCFHKGVELGDEYPSEGDNLVGEMVECVWQAGEAELAQADYNRQTKVVEAQANLQAQKFNAESEVARAKGVAQANNIIKDSITEMYVRYLWVNTLDKTNNQIIYVPEGADGLPITEAGRASK